MDLTELVHPSELLISSSTTTVEEPSQQDNRLATASAPIVMEAGENSEAMQQQEVRWFSKYLGSSWRAVTTYLEAPTILPVPLTQAKGNNSLTSLHIE